MQLHDFRTSKATHLHSIMGVKSLQTFMGHKNINTTQGYVKQTVEDLKAQKTKSWKIET